MESSTKILLTGIVIIGGGILSQYIPNECEYILGLLVGSFITLIRYL